MSEKSFKNVYHFLGIFLALVVTYVAMVAASIGLRKADLVIFAEPVVLCLFPIVFAKFFSKARKVFGKMCIVAQVFAVINAVLGGIYSYMWTVVSDMLLIGERSANIYLIELFMCIGHFLMLLFFIRACADYIFHLDGKLYKKQNLMTFFLVITFLGYLIAFIGKLLGKTIAEILIYAILGDMGYHIYLVARWIIPSFFAVVVLVLLVYTVKSVLKKSKENNEIMEASDRVKSVLFSYLLVPILIILAGFSMQLASRFVMSNLIAKEVTDTVFAPENKASYRSGLTGIDIVTEEKDDIVGLLPDDSWETVSTGSEIKKNYLGNYEFFVLEVDSSKITPVSEIKNVDNLFVEYQSNSIFGKNIFKKYARAERDYVIELDDGVIVYASYSPYVIENLGEGRVKLPISVAVKNDIDNKNMSTWMHYFFDFVQVNDEQFIEYYSDAILVSGAYAVGEIQSAKIGKYYNINILVNLVLLVLMIVATNVTVRLTEREKH